MNLTQPAVTHQVQELERRFTVALVETVRQARTQAGEKLSNMLETFWKKIRARR